MGSVRGPGAPEGERDVTSPPKGGGVWTLVFGGPREAVAADAGWVSSFLCFLLPVPCHRALGQQVCGIPLGGTRRCL